LNSTKRRAGR